ncbi:hypothetical protein KQI52_02265 [bacterium]|nr:hypothetical protein [bacterium]
MFRRKRKQPWWTWPIAVTAAVYGVIQAERHSHLIWNRMLKREAWQRFLQFLDDRFPPKTQRRTRKQAGRSTV